MTSKRLLLGGVCGLAMAGAVGYGVGRARAAGAPTMAPVLTYSGTLTDGAGSPISGMKNIQIQVWDVATGGTKPVCIAPSSAQTLVGGSFQVALPDCVAAVHASSDLWVEVLVDGGSMGRTKIGAAPYALEAGTASAAAGALATSIVPPGAVMAFDLDQCPTGWAELTDARGRTIVGTGAGTGLTARSRGAKFGEEAHTLSTAELPAHIHPGTTGAGNAMAYRLVGSTGVTGASNHANGWVGTTAFMDYNDASYPLANHTHGFTTDATGGGQPHAVIQPSLALLYCKKM